MNENINSCLSMSIMPKDTIVFSIFTPSGLIKFDQPKLASEVKCPNCGCADGILNLSERSWHCSKACFSSKKKEFKLNIESTKLFGVPDNLVAIPISSCIQSKTTKDFMIKFSLHPSGFVVFSGSFGTGKTYSACAMLEHFRSNGGTSGRFINLVDLYEKWKECTLERSNERNLIEPFIDVEFLVLDDLGTRAPSPSFLDFIYLILDKRINNRKTGTILTTNLSNNELLQIYGGRILSRIGSGINVRFAGEDRRKLNKSA